MPNSLNEELSREEIRKMLVNMQLSTYAKFLDTDADNLCGRDRIKALMRNVETPEKLRKASAVLLQKISHSLRSGVNYGSSAWI